jgi:ribosomal protein L19E
VLKLRSGASGTLIKEIREKKKDERGDQTGRGRRDGKKGPRIAAPSLEDELGWKL